MKVTVRWVLFSGYVATVIVANWLVIHVGIIAILGLAAPAGVLAAGVALSLRDSLQERGGREWVLCGIAAGAALSYLLGDGRIAVTSALAFLVSELADWGVYTPLRQRNKAGAMFLSNVVGAGIDSALFLWLAFGSLTFLPGQWILKVLVTLPLVAVAAIAEGRRAILPRHTSS